MDRLTALEVFVKVVDGQSFAAAARDLGLSPAMVSKHVQALEERLGARLLNRTMRRMSLTEIGRGYYERARQVIADLEDADRAAGDLHAAPRGLLKVNAPFSFGIRHVGPAIADYLTAYPEVSIDITLNDHYIDLLAESVDVALRIGRLADSSLIARRLAPIRLALCASPAYLRRHGTPRTPRDLAGHNCLLYTYAASGDEWRFIGPDGREEAVRVSGGLRANNGDLLQAAMGEGVGIALAPTFMIGEAVKAGTLMRLLQDYRLPESALHAVYPPGRHLTAKLRSFIDFLAKRFGDEPEWDRWCREGVDG